MVGIEEGRTRQGAIDERGRRSEIEPTKNAYSCIGIACASMSDLFDSDGLGPARKKCFSETAQESTISNQRVIPHTRWVLYRSRKTKKKKDSQIPREINVKPIHHRQVVAEQLQRDNIEDALKAVDRAGDDNLAPAGLLERRVVVAANDDWLTLAGSNLREGRLDLGIE